MKLNSDHLSNYAELLIYFEDGTIKILCQLIKTALEEDKQLLPLSVGQYVSTEFLYDYYRNNYDFLKYLTLHTTDSLFNS